MHAAHAKVSGSNGSPTRRVAGVMAGRGPLAILTNSQLHVEVANGQHPPGSAGHTLAQVETDEQTAVAYAMSQLNVETAVDTAVAPSSPLRRLLNALKHHPSKEILIERVVAYRAEVIHSFENGNGAIVRLLEGDSDGVVWTHDDHRLEVGTQVEVVLSHLNKKGPVFSMERARKLMQNWRHGDWSRPKIEYRSKHHPKLNPLALCIKIGGRYRLRKGLTELARANALLDCTEWVVGDYHTLTTTKLWTNESPRDDPEHAECQIARFASEKGIMGLQRGGCFGDYSKHYGNGISSGSQCAVLCASKQMMDAIIALANFVRETKVANGVRVSEDHFSYLVSYPFALLKSSESPVKATKKILEEETSASVSTVDKVGLFGASYGIHNFVHEPGFHEPKGSRYPACLMPIVLSRLLGSGQEKYDHFMVGFFLDSTKTGEPCYSGDLPGGKRNIMEHPPNVIPREVSEETSLPDEVFRDLFFRVEEVSNAYYQVFALNTGFWRRMRRWVREYGFDE